MVGEEYGWVPLDGWTITFLLIVMSLMIMIPGFLLSLALFPKRMAIAMSERLALSFGLGLASPLLVFVLNTLFEVKVTAVLSWVVFLALSLAGFVLFINRGGNANLMEWYKGVEKKA